MRKGMKKGKKVGALRREISAVLFYGSKAHPYTEEISDTFPPVFINQFAGFFQV